MNNHTPHNRNHNHNHNEQRQDERPFAYIMKRAPLQQQQQDRNIDTTQHMPANPEYQITIEHGSIWLGQER